MEAIQRNPQHPGSIVTGGGLNGVGNINQHLTQFSNINLQLPYQIATLNQNITDCLADGHKLETKLNNLLNQKNQWSHLFSNIHKDIGIGVIASRTEKKWQCQHL